MLQMVVSICAYIYVSILFLIIYIGKMYPTEAILYCAPFADQILYIEQYKKATFWYYIIVYIHVCIHKSFFLNLTALAKSIALWRKWPWKSMKCKNSYSRKIWPGFVICKFTKFLSHYINIKAYFSEFWRRLEQECHYNIIM